jgi:hypothetical protein
MTCKAIRFTIVLLIIARSYAGGQEMLGTAVGNYAGINGIQLNPSSMNNYRTYLEVQLVASDIFLQNNYLYLSKDEYRFSNFFKGGYQWPSHAENYGTGERTFYWYSDKQGKNAFLNIRLNGPGAMLVRGKDAIALTTSVRAVISAHNFPYDLATFSYIGLNYRPYQAIDFQHNRSFNAAALVWGEVGLSYSRIVYEQGFNKISAGISVRRLMGAAGLYVSSTNMNYIVFDDSTASVKNMNMKGGLSLPVNYSDNSFSSNPLIKGGGFGVDLGATYVHLKRYHEQLYFNKLCSQTYEDYDYRLGFALIDIGAIQFKTNAINYGIDNRSSYWQNLNHYHYVNVNQLLDTISFKSYGDNKSANKGNKFLIWLPAALSVQFDYHYRNNWYINGSLIYALQFSGNTLSRPSQISITPRYETRWLEVNMPVSLYDWRLLRFGFSLRIYGFTIGTDKIGGYFHFNDFTGLDFYFSIRFFLEKGKCRNRAEKGCADKDYRTTSKH